MVLRSALLVLAAVLGLLASPQAARADDCLDEATLLFVGGHEGALISTSTGVAADAVPRNPILCTRQAGQSLTAYESASAAWAMIYSTANPFYYHQVGWRQIRGESAASWFSEWNDGSVPTTRKSSTSPTSGTRYRLVVKYTTLWNGYVLLDSDGSMVWNAPDDPTSHSWYPTDAKYAAETWNHGDRTPGTSSLKARLDTLRWYDENGDIVYAYIPSVDRFNDDSSTYHASWGADYRSFDLWSDP